MKHSIHQQQLQHSASFVSLSYCSVCIHYAVSFILYSHKICIKVLCVISLKQSMSSNYHLVFVYCDTLRQNHIQFKGCTFVKPVH